MTTLRRNDRGEAVKNLQSRLGLYPDGIFGPLTEEAVREFQRRHNLTIDGVCGKQTWKKLLSAQPERIDDFHIVVEGLKKSRRSITEIYVHCTATPEGQDTTVAQLRAEHIKNRGFSDIGYHYVVYRDGSVHVGRDVDYSGAHVKGHNPHSIGIVYVGGVENVAGVPYSDLNAKDTRTVPQKNSLELLLRKLRLLYPHAKILGHRDASPDLNNNGYIEPSEWIKECPSFDASWEYRNI
jgi:N-acetyl-anhydromuramyl-L-alanine amidase AmpD